MTDEQTTKVNQALKAARRTGFLIGNSHRTTWTRDEIAVSAVIMVVFTAGFTAIGLWLVEKLMPGGS